MIVTSCYITLGQPPVVIARSSPSGESEGKKNKTHLPTLDQTWSLSAKKHDPWIPMVPHERGKKWLVEAHF